jgi:hypothetical protein
MFYRATNYQHVKHSVLSKKWGFACVAMLIVIFILDSFLERYLDEKSDPKKLNETTSAPLKPKPTITPEMPEANKKMLRVVSVELPAVPVDNQASSNANQHTHSFKHSAQQIHAKIVQQSPSNVVETATQSTVNSDTKNVFPEKETLEGVRSSNTEISASTLTETQRQQQIDNVLADFSHSEVSISLPTQASIRDQVVTFLYQCVGIGLASLNPHSGGHELMPLTPMPKQASHLLRRISGEVGSRERQLKQAYAPNQALIRVYPLHFDRALSANLVNALEDAKLSQFLGQYDLVGRRLYIQNMILNGRQLSGKWLIFDGYAQPCRL